MLSKLSAYRRDFDETKYMSFKTKKMPKYITDDIEVTSDDRRFFDKEDCDKEYSGEDSDEENSDKESSNK